MKRKRWMIWCLVLTMAVMSLTGCGGDREEKSGKIADRISVTVTMPTSSEPEAGFDPAYGWGAGEHVHEPLIQSTLLVTTKDLKIDKDLATDYSVSEDGLTWTVKLRDDVKFTDGERLTADDVAFTYNHCKKNSTVNDFTMLDQAVAIDDMTVEFHMNRPFSIWPYTMAIVGIIPEHAYDRNYAQNPIGSGRYVLKQWDRGQQIIFEANPDYYGRKAKIKRLTVLFMEEDAAFAAALSGEVDVAHTAASFAEEEVGGYHLLRVASVDNRGINLPVTEPTKEHEGNSVTSDLAVRRAINIGIDRDKMIQYVLNGYGTPAYSVCDKMPWYNEKAEVAYDLAGAKKILEEAGWKEGSDGIRKKDGKKAEFTVMYHPQDSVRQALAEEFANQCRKLGIAVTTEGAGWDVAYDKALSQPLVWGWGAHTPMELYNIYHTGSNKDTAVYSPYANETVDSYMDEALQAKDLETSYDLWKKAQWDGTTGITQDGDIPWVWFCNVDHLYYVRDELKVAEQKIHPHGHGWSLVNNVDQWEWSE